MKRLAIFAHYDLTNSIDEYVINYLKALKKNVDKILFISDCNLDEKELTKIKDLITDSICARHGESNDFGSYKRGFQLFITKYQKEFSEIDELVLANDSCYCLGDFEQIFREMEKTDFDAWGLNDHYLQLTTLLQSNFMVFRKNVFQAEFLKNFFDGIGKLEKKDVITQYEIGLSKLMVANGKKLGVYFGYQKIENYLGNHLAEIKDELTRIIISKHEVELYGLTQRILKHSTGHDYVYSDHFYLLLKIGCPLLKCIALVPNKETAARNTLINFWKDIVAEIKGQDASDMIQRHITKIKKIAKSPNLAFTWDQNLESKNSQIIKNRIAIFAHYDIHGKIDEYVIQYLRFLKNSVDKIIFSSDCLLEESEIAKIKDLIFDYTFEKHGEYDFGSHKRGFNLLASKHPQELANLDELILANDSCYCVGGFKHIFKYMENIDCDAWSLGDDYENYKTRTYYLQSYFIVFRKSVFLENFFQEFINNITKLESKGDIIFKYEIGLSTMLQQHGKKLFAYFSAAKVAHHMCDNYLDYVNDLKAILTKSLSFTEEESLDLARNTFDISALNYVHSNKFYILIKLNFPLLKRAILDRKLKKFNSEKLTYFWAEIIRECTYSNPKIISNHLSRTKVKFKTQFHLFLYKAQLNRLMMRKNFVQIKFTTKGKVIIKILKIPVFRTSSPIVIRAIKYIASWSLFNSKKLA